VNSADVFVPAVGSQKKNYMPATVITYVVLYLWFHDWYADGSFWIKFKWEVVKSWSILGYHV